MIFACWASLTLIILSTDPTNGRDLGAASLKLALLGYQLDIKLYIALFIQSHAFSITKKYSN